MAILVTNTTGSNINISDLGDLILLPGVNDLTAVVSPEAIKLSKDIQMALEVDRSIGVSINGDDLINLTKVSGGVSFPAPSVSNVRVISTQDPTNFQIEILGAWLTSDTQVRVVSPSGVITNSSEYSGIDNTTLDKTILVSLNIENKGGETDLVINCDNYGRESTLTVPGSGALLTANPPSIELDLRAGGSNLNLVDRSPQIGSDDVLVWDLADATSTFNRNAQDGVTNGTNGDEARTWYKFYGLNYPLNLLEKIEFIVYNHTSSNRFWCALASDGLNVFSPKNSSANGDLALSFQFRSNDLRMIQGYDQSNPGNYITDQVRKDLRSDTYYRLEIHIVDRTARLYELAGPNSQDWYTVGTDILNLPTNYLDNFYLGDSTYAPTIHFLTGVEEAGVLAIRSTFR